MYLDLAFVVGVLLLVQNRHEGVLCGQQLLPLILRRVQPFLQGGDVGHARRRPGRHHPRHQALTRVRVRVCVCVCVRVCVKKREGGISEDRVSGARKSTPTIEPVFVCVGGR